MVIDTHIHPALFAPICEDQERFRRRCDAMNYHLMKPSDMALLRKQYALADIGRVVLLPEDCSVESGMVEISNDEIAKLVALDAQFYIGMAPVAAFTPPTMSAAVILVGSRMEPEMVRAVAPSPLPPLTRAMLTVPSSLKLAE